MDECQSSHIEQIMTWLATIKCDKNVITVSIPYGLVVRILGFHPRGSGSIPGMGDLLIKLYTTSCG